MPAQDIDLPSTLEKSSDKIKRTYKETLDNALDQYDGDEERAHRTAWGSVKNIAEKKGDHWELKDGTGPSDSRSKKSTDEKRAGKGDTYSGVDIEGNTKEELEKRAKKAGISGYSDMNKEELADQLSRHE